MATSKAAPKKMCCVSIGHSSYLLPADKGMKLVELLQDAYQCNDRYEQSGFVYQVQEQPAVEFKLVRADQIRMPHGTTEPFPLPSQRRLLK